MTLNQDLRELPSVDEILSRLDAGCPRDLLAAETRRVIDKARMRLKAGEKVDLSSIPTQVLAGLEELERTSLRRVINATGVIVHTNLGRAPLASFGEVEGYSNLEYDVEAGKRGKRDSHLAPLLERLLARPGIAVNNNAAAIYLALNELAGGGEVVVSRGELIEIGDGFRIPDIMLRAGVTLREVGTTNRTHVDDYRNALSERTRLILRVHPSNFHIEGFTAKPELRDLAGLARERGIPLYEDLGSGCIADLRPYGIDEPRVSESFEAGVNLVSFSGDKLLGGPQSGILAGDAELVARLRRNPMYRALRLDKLILAALESTLRQLLFCRWERIPVLRMIATPVEELHGRAEALVARLGRGEVREGKSVIGGGSTPAQSLPAWLVTFDCNAAAVERKLRAGTPPVIARIENERLVVDLRTVALEEEPELIAALHEAL